MIDEIIFFAFLLYKLNIVSPQSTERILYMKFTTFASFMIFVVFLVWLQYEIKKHSRYDEKVQKEFWERETEANSTRKKSLEYLNYITIPINELPMKVMADNELVKEYHETIYTLSEEKIVNFTGISNTDLKLEYGVANLPLVSHYDQCYTTLVRTLQQWGQLLYKNGYQNECRQILEFAVRTGTDVSGTYRLLAQIYVENGEIENLVALKEKASTLNSAMQKPICRMLKEFDL